MKNIFIAIIVIVMLPLLFASISEASDSGNQDLKGFSARDIQYIESIGFVDNLDGSWTISLTGLTPNVVTYVFDFQPFTNDYGIIMSMNVVGTTALRLQFPGGYRLDKVGGTLTIWGGDVS